MRLRSILVIAVIAASAAPLAAATAQSPRQVPPADVIDLERLEGSERARLPLELIADPGASSVDGVCNVQFDVAADGRVVAESIMADCNRAGLVEAAESTVAQWTYEPLVIDGEARAQPGMSATVRFRSVG